MLNNLILSSSVARLTDGPGRKDEIERAKVSLGVFLKFITAFCVDKCFP